ncbi:hypothetical protein ACIGG9_16040 [Pseudonocardia alni]|uniref:hypothetical protein n=1 Tax=Pseudonocardia alni TaxID=33907 RepID=UPI0033FBD9EA
MTSYPQNGPAELHATFLDHVGGQPVDPTAVVARIFLDDDLVAGPFTYPATVTRELLGLYSVTWQVPADAQLADDYTIAWTATIGGFERVGYEQFEVIKGGSVTPGELEAWASVADVATLTGQTVTSADALMAQSVVEMFAGRTYEATSRISRRDLKWLRKAVAYEAAWIPENPDLFERLDLLEISGNTGSSSLPLTAKAMVLAPMARWSLTRVSWLRSRSIRPRAPFLDGTGRRSALVDHEDDRWVPMGGR